MEVWYFWALPVAAFLARPPIPLGGGAGPDCWLAGVSWGDGHGRPVVYLVEAWRQAGALIGLARIPKHAGDRTAAHHRQWFPGFP